MTSTVHDPFELLRNTLEEQFQRHTDRLAELTVCGQQRGRGGYEIDSLAALIVSSRRAVADTAQALRRMADGSDGSCERCAGGIPPERLEILPQARFCVPCQAVPLGRLAPARASDPDAQLVPAGARRRSVARRSPADAHRDRGARTLNRRDP